MTIWTLNGRTWGYRQADVPGQPYFLMGSQVFKVWHLLMQDLAAECAGVNTESGLAEAAKVAAVAAQALAEAARDAAATSATGATGSATAAGGSATAAETARVAAVAAKNLAEAARDAAAASATSAAGSATAAGGSATAANGSAVAAAASELAAASSAAAAALDRSAAQTAATAAGNSATAAAADRVQTGTDRASVATALATAQALVGSAGTGTATGLAYAALTKSLVTATDVVATLIYDTRLDSDGGAWTDRPFGSWYWETLGTAIRGAMRRFPKVAGIVARATLTGATVTIYDCHDLDASGVPRMWMVIPATAPWWGQPQAATCLFALNGRVWIGTNTGTDGRFHEIDFVADVIERGGVAPGSSRVRGPIAARGTATLGSAGSGRIKADFASPQINAIHARVIPGGPLDSAGLPIPTLAVATAGGVSVIHPNGAVYDITGAAFRGVSLTASGRLLVMYDASAQVDVGAIPYADVARTSWRQYAYSPTNVPVLAPSTATAQSLSAQAIGYSDRLTLLAEDTGNPANGMTAFVSTNYATGWQPGDIRGAWLCDTPMGNVTGSGELLTNGDLSAGTTGWAAGANTGAAATLSISSGKLRVTNAATSNVGFGAQTIATVPGQTYLIVGDLAPGGAYPVDISVYDGGGSILLDGQNYSSATAGVLAQFTAISTSTQVRLRVISATAGDYGDYDNISVRLALPDRSYKGKGVMVNGSLSRTALACGLAAVSGFSGSNYLEQPYNPDLDFGTGDFAIAFWSYCNDVGASRCILGRGQASSMSSAGRWSIIHLSSSGDYAFTVGDGSGVKLISGGSVGGASTTWRQCVALRRAGVMELWVDGVRVATDTSTANVSNTSAILRVGAQPDGTATGFGVAAVMARVTAYAPTPAQIRKMYEDERALIVGGTPATLGGTSNSVTALAANDGAGTLAVGTGDGISIMAGLGRGQYLDGASGGAAIGNDAITALSASGPHLLIGTSAGAGIISDSVIARDRLGSSSRPAARPDEIKVRGVTLDATATLLTPLLWVGERETGVARLTMTGRVYGTAASENGVWSLSARFSRDAGGSVAILTEADSQGGVRWDTGTPGAESWTDKTAGAMAVAIVTSGTEYIGAQLTGLGATRIEWEGTLTWERIARDQTYAA